MFIKIITFIYKFLISNTVKIVLFHFLISRDTYLIYDFLTFVILYFNSYFLHRLTHVKFIEKFFFNIHINIHHKIPRQDITIVQHFLNVVYEFVLTSNIFLLLIPFFNKILNIKMMYIYAILYIIGHNITNHIENAPEHELHHKNSNVNFGPRSLDILFETYKSP